MITWDAEALLEPKGLRSNDPAEPASAVTERVAIGTAWCPFWSAGGVAHLMLPGASLIDHHAGPAQAMMMMRSVVHVTLPEETGARDRPDEAGQSAGEGGRVPLATHDCGSSVWQLVTAHSNGQLQVWDPSLGSIKPVLRIGDPCSSCRSEPMCHFARRC